MGGGSSVLSPELSKSLTQPSLNEFHRFQLECEAKHMTPVEMYLYLSQKYEELVLAEKSAVKEIAAAIKQDRKEKKTTPTAQGQQQMLHSASAANTSAVASSSSTTNHNHNHSPRTSARRKSADHTETLSSPHKVTSNPASPTGEKGVKSPEEIEKERLKKLEHGELPPSTLILTNGQAVRIPSSAEFEENAIAEELKMELAAMATEEEFEYRDSDDEDSISKANDRPNFTHDPYLESVVGKVFQVKDTTSSKSTPQIKALVKKLNPTAHNNVTSPSTSISATPRAKDKASTSRGGNNVTPKPMDKIEDTETDFVIGETIVHHDLATGVYTCAVCQLNFENRSSLDVHLEHSPLHSMNLKIRQDIYQGTILEAERLGKLAKLAISKMMIPKPNTEHNGTSGGHHHHHDHNLNHHEEVQHRWKRAINKVISYRLKQHYMPIIEELFDTPPGVKMLYAGEKIFYQTRSHMDIHLYLHIAMDVVEVVIHSLPNRKQREKSKMKVAQEIREHDEHPQESATTLGGIEALMGQPTEDHSSDYLKPFIKPLARLYLDFGVLVPMVLGIDRVESGLSMDPHAAVMQAHVKNQVESNQFVSGITSRYAAINTTAKDVAEAKKMSQTIEQAIVSFILNRLRVTLANPSDHKTERDPAKKFVIGFDFSNCAGHPLLDPKQLKADFKPVPLSDERIRKHYDRKLYEEVSHEVHPSANEKAGAVAVDEAVAAAIDSTDNA